MLLLAPREVTHTLIKKSVGMKHQLRKKQLLEMCELCGFIDSALSRFILVFHNNVRCLA